MTPDWFPRCPFTRSEIRYAGQNTTAFRLDGKLVICDPSIDGLIDGCMVAGHAADRHGSWTFLVFSPLPPGRNVSYLAQIGPAELLRLMPMVPDEKGVTLDIKMYSGTKYDGVLNVQVGSSAALGPMSQMMLPGVEKCVTFSGGRRKSDDRECVKAMFVLSVPEQGYHRWLADLAAQADRERAGTLIWVDDMKHP